MRSRLLVLSLFVAAAAMVWLVRPSTADGPSTAQLGKKIDNLQFTDADGKALSLYDLKDKKAIVLVFLSFDCPVSQSYSQPLADMAKAFDKLGVAFLGLTVNQDETLADVAKHAKEFQ